MKTRMILSAVLLASLLVSNAPAATWYVAPGGNNGAGTNWVTAKQTIQAAIDLAASNDTVLVSNGVYATGGRVVFGTMTNRVAITNAITVRSVNGPSVTSIRGAWNAGTTNGNAAVRCVYVGTNAVLSGFSLTNGATRSGGDAVREQCGGGAWCEAGAAVSNCVIAKNAAYYHGGGSYGGTLLNCTLSSNSARIGGGGGAFGVWSNCTLSGNTGGSGGGGSYAGTLSHCTVSANSATYGGGCHSGTVQACTITGNAATYGGGSHLGDLANCLISSNAGTYGGGAYGGALVNCTIIGNTATSDGGGSLYGTLENCIVYYNAAPGGPNWYGATIGTSCTTPDPGGSGNTTNEPMTAGAFNPHLLAASPCVDAGNNAAAAGADIDDEPRIAGGTVDLGCDEYTTPVGGTLSAQIRVQWTNVATGFELPFEAVVQGAPQSLVWTWGDGNAASNFFRTCHAFATGGVFAVTLTVTNGTGSASATVTVRAVSQPVYYVAPGGGNLSPYTNWTRAATTIQAALDVAIPGSLVLVSNGTYSTGSRVVAGAVANRVAVTNPVVVRSANGPTATVIKGTWAATTNGDTAVRCVYLATNATLCGFTLSNGATRAAGDILREQSGGGVWCETNAVVTNCILVRNAAALYGGGSEGGTLLHCTLAGNGAMIGGGADNGTLRNCTLYGNGAEAGGGCGNSALFECVLYRNTAHQYGGGGIYSTLNDCTLTGNCASVFGGGASYGALNNCVVRDNVAGSAGGGTYGSTARWCNVSFNVATNGGGGAASGVLDNCIVTGNRALQNFGGGMYYSTANNCTIVSNSVVGSGGGASYGALNNCIVCFNSATASSNNVHAAAMTNCCSPEIPAGGTGNITNDPQFVDAAASDFHLQAASPCIDTGSNAFVRTDRDADGNPRIVNGRVDIGAYEYRGAGSPNLVWYVAPSGSDADPGTNWATAKQTIQGAIDRTISGDTAIVSNGVYATGGRTVGGFSLTNRITVTNAITLQSVNGPLVTTIMGAWNPGTTFGDNAVRCVFLGSNATLSGFTLTNGSTRAAGDQIREQRGGGVFCEAGALVTGCVMTGCAAFDSGGGSYQGTLRNCTYLGNSAGIYGGGSAGGIQYDCHFAGNFASNGGGGSAGTTLSNCTLTGNSAGLEGGAVAECTMFDCTLQSNSAFNAGGGSMGGYLFNCTLSGNSAQSGGGSVYGRLDRCILSGNTSLFTGGGSYRSIMSNCLIVGNSAGSMGGGSSGGTLNNCTIVGNSATNQSGGGSSGSFLNNCIIFFNVAAWSSNCDGSVTLDYCCTPTPGAIGVGNITNDPQFVDAAASNFHLKATSPCIDAGSNSHGSGAATDFDGNRRIVHGAVDMGAYEFQPYWWWASAITNGLTNANQCATGDGYPNLLKFATGSNPTQSDSLARMNCTQTNGLFALRFFRNTNAFDVTLLVEGSYAATSHAPWTGLATNIGGTGWNTTNVVESGAGSPVVVTVQDAVTGATNRFLRLRVMRP